MEDRLLDDDPHRYHKQHKYVEDLLIRPGK